MTDFELDRTLLPTVTDTVTVRTLADGATDQTLATERTYQLEAGDQIWVGLSSVTVQRGDRYSGTEQVLRLSNYGGDVFRSALIEMVRHQISAAADESSEFCRKRAADFLEELRAVLA